jgi:hypothetical protein
MNIREAEFIQRQWFGTQRGSNLHLRLFACEQGLLAVAILIDGAGALQRSRGLQCGSA